MSSIEDRVKKIVVEQLGVSEDQVTPDASFVDDLGADSLDTVELVMALEEEFDAEIPDDQAEKITTVKQAVEFIQANTNGRNPWRSFSNIVVKAARRLAPGGFVFRQQGTPCSISGKSS